MDHSELKERISTVLDEHYFKIENGLFYDEVYVDYQDELGDDAAKEILRSKAPMDVLTEKLTEWYQEAVWRLEDQAIGRLRDDPDLNKAFEENEDLFRDTLFEVFCVTLPYQHFLDQTLDLVLAFDTGNFNVDCTLEGFAHSYYGDREEGVDEYSSLLWLCEQQGVSKAELEHALKTGEYYPKEISELLNRHHNIIRQMKDLGFVPNKPMDRYNQKGAFNTLTHAEDNVRNHSRSLEKYRANLADCELSYEQFCEKWSSIPGNRNFGRTPPSREEWNRRRTETRARLTDAIAMSEAQVANDKAHLEEVLNEPGVAAAAKLRDELYAMAEPYTTMKHSEEYRKGRFLESVIVESENVTSHMNTLTALLRMPLHKAMELAEVINGEEHLNKSYIPEERKGGSSILLSQDSILGLYDPWYGSGSMFGIKLRQPLEVPVRLIHDANIDGNLGYSIDSIYGGQTFQENSLLEIRSIPPEQEKAPLNQVLQNAQSTTQIQQETLNLNDSARNIPPER